MATFIQGTGQVYAPTPDSPVEIQSVTGLQNIEVCGKNLFDKSTIIEGQYIDGSGVIQNDPGNFLGDFISIDNTKSYYVSSNSSSAKRIGYYNSNKEYISREVLGVRSSILTIPSNAKYVRLSCYNDNLDTLQLEQGSTATSYEPYKGNTYEINLGKQLLDENALIIGTFTYDDSGNRIITNNYVSMEFIAVKPNTTYTYSASTPSGYAAIRIVSFTGSKTFINRSGNISFTNKTATFTTSSNTYYIAILMYKTTTDADISEISNKQLEKGSQATSYSPYFTPIELNKISDYQDRIYKDNGKWYVEKNIGKVDLSTLSWNSASHQASGYRRYYTTTIPNVKYVSSNTQLGVGLAEKYSIHTGQGMGSYGAENCFAIDVSMVQAVDTQTPTGLFYYALNTPTYTEITNTELINQLESIELLKGENNISITSENLPALLQLSYYKQTLQGNIEYLDETKANKEDIPSLDNYYNKTETDTLLDDKADVSDIPDLTNYVKNTDYATTSKTGVIKGSSYYGFEITNAGVPYLDAFNYTSYQSKDNNCFISKGTLENVITGKGLIDNSVNNLTNYTKTSDLSSVATSGSYNDLSDKPTIPTIPINVSTFTNDAGYITNSVNNLTNYTTTTDMNTALGNKQNTILSGTSDPDSSLGEDGDIYIQYES